MKKYKMHKRRNKSSKLIFAIFAISTFFVSYGYSSLADTIKLTGTASLKYEQTQTQDVNDIYEPIKESSNYLLSTYTYENVSNWQQGDNTYIYEINLKITNLDKDYDSGNLEIGFDEKQGLSSVQTKENLGILQAEKVLIAGSRITVLLKEANSQVKYGEEINISLYITYENEQKGGITLENITLNGNPLGKAEPKVETENSDIQKIGDEVKNDNIVKIEENTTTDTTIITSEKNKEDDVQNKENENSNLENMKDNINNPNDVDKEVKKDNSNTTVLDKI